MPNKDEYESAARKPPSARTPAEQALVARGSNIQSVRNLDEEARRQERIYGSGRR